MGSATLPRLTGEVLGTAVLVFFGVGALLTSGGGTFIGAIGLLFAAAIAAWIFGGHFNPWITLASAIRGTTDWLGALLIIVAQLVGGVLGALLMWSAYGEKAISSGLGANHLPPETVAMEGKGLAAAIVAEALAIFILCSVALVVGDGEKGGIAMGIAYAAGTMAIYVVTTASLNLARTLGPEITLVLAGGESEWKNIWIFPVSGIIGAALAGLVYPLWRPDAPPATEPASTEE